MFLLTGIRQLIGLNYNFIKHKLKDRKERSATNRDYQARFSGKVVLNGIFKGLRYTDFKSVCSAIYPKLIGSYENEIQNDLSLIISKKPSLIIDIGCAEGYYAVGLARLLPDSKIIAADISEEARNLCIQLAEFNDCSNVKIVGAITADNLISYDLENAFIICDCEGYEKQLFNTQVLPYLRNTYLIIETHDFIDPSISIYLEKLFSDTHHIKVVASIDDLLKAKYYHFTELKDINLSKKRELLAEYRPTIMEWLILEPKR